jgi:hypothetical protein
MEFARHIKLIAKVYQTTATKVKVILFFGVHGNLRMKKTLNGERKSGRNQLIPTTGTAEEFAGRRENGTMLRASKVTGSEFPVHTFSFMAYR